MVNQVIQAVAGSGKTFYGTHTLVKGKKCLYLTFTNGNVRNINLELLNSGFDMSNYEVLTFSKFVCNWLIRPFYSLLKPTLTPFRGYTTVEPPQNLGYSNGYIKKEFNGHYLDQNGCLYLSRISELIINQNKEIKNMMFERIKRFVDLVIVDEYQDLTGKEFDVLKLIMKQSYFDVSLTGDVFQAGVSSSAQHKPSKLLKYNDTDRIDAFIKKVFGIKSISVESDKLKKSRRISPECAEFVKSRLGIDIESSGLVQSGVHFIRNVDELKNISNKKLTILTYNRSVKRNLKNQNYCTWSYVKGNTYTDVLVVLTRKTDSILEKTIDSKVTQSVKNKLYVALTRAKGELYIVTSKVWSKANKICD